MNYSLLICLFLSSVLHAESVYSPRVIDGDTFDTGIKPFTTIGTIKARIIGIDTPELHGQCLQERIQAAQAKEFLSNLFRNKTINYNVINYDKYGGRIDVNAFVDGKNVADLLKEQKLARPYYNGIRQSWCNTNYTQ